MTGKSPSPADNRPKAEHGQETTRETLLLAAAEVYARRGYQRMTMENVLEQAGLSRPTLYKYFSNKEKLIEEGTEVVHQKIHAMMDEVMAQNHNAIAENFQMREMFKQMFQSFDQSPAYQLKKHYPEIYQKMVANEIEDCSHMFRQNIEKGIAEGLYRKETDIEAAVNFYYTLIFSINENTALEKDAYEMELKALEYHTRAIATPKGITELEKHLQLFT